MLPHQLEKGRRRTSARGQDVRGDLGGETGEVVERVTLARLGEVDQPDQPARADQRVFQVEVAVDGGPCPLQRGLQPAVEPRERVVKPEEIEAAGQVTSSPARSRTTCGGLSGVRRMWSEPAQADRRLPGLRLQPEREGTAVAARLAWVNEGMRQSVPSARPGAASGRLLSCTLGLNTMCGGSRRSYSSPARKA